MRELRGDPAAACSKAQLTSGIKRTARERIVAAEETLPDDETACSGDPPPVFVSASPAGRTGLRESSARVRSDIAMAAARSGSSRATAPVAALRAGAVWRLEVGATSRRGALGVSAFGVSDRSDSRSPVPAVLGARGERADVPIETLMSRATGAPSDPPPAPAATSTPAAPVFAAPPTEGEPEGAPGVSTVASTRTPTPAASAVTTAAGAFAGGKAATWADAASAKTATTQNASIALRVLLIF